MRVALVTNLPTHYRQPIFEELAGRLEVDFYFTSAGREQYWSADHTLATNGLSVRPAAPRRALYRSLVDGEYDAIVCSLTGRAALIGTLAAAARGRIPLVLWVGLWLHPTTLFHRLSRPLVRSLYRRADAMLVYGSHVARHVAAESGRRDRVFIAPQAVDNDRFRRSGGPHPRSGRRLQLGYVGRLADGKGLDVLFEGVRRSSDDVTLRVIGSGPHDHDLRALAKASGIAQRVEFAGYVSQELLPQALADLDVLVLPSVTTAHFRETWGLVVNEAMNAGVAVVVTTAVGAAAGGLVIDGESGLVVPEGDSAALAAAFDRLARDDGLRLALAEVGREHVRHLTFSAAADSIERAVHGAIEHRS